MFIDTFINFPSIETDRLYLCELNAENDSDINDMYECYLPEEITRYTDGKSLSREEWKKTIINWREDWMSREFIRWGLRLKETRRIIGGVYLYNPVGNDINGRRMDIGIMLRKEYWHRGYAYEAFNTVVDYAFSTMNIVRLQSEILPENTASLKLCEKAGFKAEGILRNYSFYEHNGKCLKSVVMMARLKDEQPK